MNNSISDEFENLKISAFSKVKKIQRFQHQFNVTIGPDSIDLENEDKTNTITIVETREIPIKKQEYETSPVNSNRSILLQKVIQDSEHQRCSKVKEAVYLRVKLFEDFSKNQQTTFKHNWLQKQQELIERTERQEQFMLQALEKYEQDASAHHQLLLQHHKQAEERIQKNLELQALEEKRQQMKLFIEKICKNQHSFRSVYEEIVALLKTCTNPQELYKKLEDKSSKLKSLPENMDKVIEKCKTGQIGEMEYQQSVNIVNDISSLKDLVKSCIEQIENEESDRKEQDRQQKELEQKRKEQEQANFAAQALAARQQQEEKPLAADVATVQKPETVKPETGQPQLSAYISSASFKMYQELQSHAQSFKDNCQDILKNPQLKQYRISLNKCVNIPLNTIASQDARNLLDKYERLMRIFSGKTVEISDNVQANASQHPQGIIYCKDLLAKQFVVQGELTISSKPEAAFSYAAVMVALWLNYPDFGKLVLAHFHQQCPYLIPFYPPRTVDQSDEEFYRAQGYKYSDGVVEKQDLFLKRMTGITRLYAAVITTKLKMAQQGQPHPHGPNMAWRWLAAILNLEPRPDITATVLFTFLEVAGSTMQEVYGKQFNKIILFIMKDYIQKLKKIDTGGPVTRLEVMLQSIQKTGRFESPKGKLPLGFW